jgi:acyl-CoA synthetase (NDP forming)
MNPTVMLASAKELESLFNPRGIVFVGKLDLSEMDIERSKRFGRPFCYVNPRKPEAPTGGPVYASLAEVPDDYNVAIIRLGARGVPAAVEDCARRGIRKIVVFASGFAESGPEGREIERQLIEIVERTGVLLIGPNTTENALESAPVPPEHRGGLIGLITHSGGQGRAITEGTAIGAGFSRWVPLGNEVGIDSADMINYFAHDPHTAVIAAYVEGFKSGPKLRAALQAANDHNKPVVMLKIGSSKKGAEVAASHTGHLAGADAPIDGLFAQHGVVRVRDLDQLVETANLFAKLPRGTGTRCAMYSYSGANVAIMSEVADTCGIEIPAFSAATQAALKTYLPANQRLSNPIDSGGVFSTDNPMERRIEALDLVAADPNIDLVIFGVCAAYKWPAEAFSDELPAWAPRAAKPVLAIYSSPEYNGAVFANVVRSGVPVFRSFHGCFQALRAFARYQECSRHFRVRRSLGHSLSGIADRALAAAGILPAADASRLLADSDISLAREALVHSQVGACAAAAAMDAPVAMKLMSPDFPHKSDVGLLRMDVSGPARVRATYKDLIERARQLNPDARIDGVLVQEQVGAGVEMIIGLTHDPQMGPTLTIGAGGIYAEILSDVAVRPLPVDADDIREMLGSLKVTKLLAGARGAKPADREGFIALALRVAALAESANGRIAELDLNPVIVQSHRAIAVDALVVSSRATPAATAVPH